MLFLLRAMLAGSMIGATVAGSVALAAADAMPNFSVEPSCRAAARNAAQPDYTAVCRNSEQKARDEVERQWPQLNAADKAQCVPTATAGGNPTYTELLTCLELAREVRQIHAKGQSTTTGQGVK
jgi:hypothetical protein